ncbi:GATOR complex protein MIOS-like isoform X2 [Anneissia japonica]|uniref:GATOR complex protein MIOS-like isoform X2 n=1 Tax=Anneissia japonica TaxID=1529436 RepID=UPI0014258FDB|nr:GATOR complex protein MIOS-like isoform X2 [Anneissia japonica]
MSTLENMFGKVKKDKSRDMNNSKWDVKWSPAAKNLFLTFRAVPPDLTLFQVGKLDEDDIIEQNTAENTSEAKTQTISLNLSAWPIGGIADLNIPNKSEVKCYAWQPKAIPGVNLIGVGMSTGKVLLTSFDQESTPDFTGLVGHEFNPKHGRPCHLLEWNSSETNLLLAGYDKYRGDPGIAMWDVRYQGREADKTKKLPGLADGQGTVSKPLAEFGSPGEIIHSMQWLISDPTCFLAGIGSKHIRLYDIRDSSRTRSQVTTKSVQGISVDPCSDYRFSSFGETQTHIWDLRKLDRFIHNIVEPRPVVKVTWCPTRYNRLACLTDKSSVIKVYSIEHLDKEMEHNEMNLQTNGGNQVASFAWHPTHENRILSITTSGLLKDTVVADLMPMSWSPQSSLLVGSGRHLQVMPVRCQSDISTKIKDRALKGYGLKKEQIWENGELVDDGTLRQFWLILDHIKSLHKDRNLQKMRTNPFYGVKDLIAGEIPGTAFCLRSTEQNMHLEGAINSPDIIHVYTSQERTIALRLCNWDFQNPAALDIYIARLVENGEFERAAAIQMFNLNLRKAIETLNLGASSTKKKEGDINLSAMAMALSGYDSTKKTLWQEMCSRLCKQLKNAYLMAMFTFLTCDDGNFSAVLDECIHKMSIQDRVAFACIFLNDVQLSKYIKRLSEEAQAEGNLEGILLTGLTEDGIKLITSYIDKTADVQTASVVAVLAFPCHLSKDPVVQNWIDCYRNLLDTWRLWHERAKFDVFMQQESTRGKEELQQIFVTCHYCQSPLSPSPYINHVQASRNARMMESNRDPGRRAKKNICHTNKCRKPLPRCCLCLMNMGTDSLHSEKFENTKTEEKQTDFKNWMTWCQSCRHGGHSHHMKEWFSGHVECPVTACTCRCMLMDSVGSISSLLAPSW